MKKTLSNCSPAILGIAQKEIALIHHKCHFHFDQKEEKNVKGSSLLELLWPARKPLSLEVFEQQRCLSKTDQGLLLWDQSRGAGATLIFHKSG